MGKAVQALRITCHATDDDDVDELFMFYNGIRFWPNAGDGTVGATATGTYNVFSPIVAFNGNNVRFSLRDDESPLGSDSLGWIDVSPDEPVGEHQADFDGGGDDGHYTLTYKVGNSDF
ncbi:hypothetical protein ACFZAB_34325 [Streptomyces albogriseolus]|uniref:hypothetical protein n=1 Tax=Streptomyces albogriseolus TaxID=1887 RepID=UPI003645CFAA